MKGVRIVPSVWIRRFNTIPSNTSYYKLGVEDLDAVLGPKRIESSRIEATMRRIAQKLFLNDGTQRALLENEISEDEKLFVNDKYLKDFVDARDLAPRQLPTSQSRLAKELRHTLQSNHPSIVHEVAQILWKHPIRRRSTYQMVAREMLRLGHGNAAQHIMESLLMVTRKKHSSSASSSSLIQGTPTFDHIPLGISAYTLCLELAMANGDHTWFMELSKANSAKGNSPLRHKFELEEGDPSVELMLAEGFMKFSHPHLLDEVLRRNSKSPFYVKLLAVSMEMAARYNDERRAIWTFNEFVTRFNPSKTATVRFLLLARKHPATKIRAAQYVPKLSPSKQKLYRLKEPVWQYLHPYAN